MTAFMAYSSKYHATEADLVTENDYVEAAKKNPAKFEVLYNKYYDPIFRFIYQRMDDKEMAYDVTSQVFLKALTNLKKYTYRGVPFSSWLYRIALSEINQFFRDRKSERTVNVETESIKDMVEVLDEDYLELYKSKLIEAIAELDEESLMLVEMRFFEKRAFKEIAEILNITENNAKVKTYRVLDKLKKFIEKK